MKKFRKMLTKILALTLVAVFFTSPSIAYAATPPNPTYVYVDPDGYKYFEFGYIPYYIPERHSGALENNENNTYWRVPEGGKIVFDFDVAYPVTCNIKLVKLGYPKNQLIYEWEELVIDGWGSGWYGLPAGNYVIYIVPIEGDAVITAYRVDTRIGI